MRLTRLNQLLDESTKRKGRWELGPNHELQYRQDDAAEEITLRGSLVAAEPRALVLSVSHKQADHTLITGVYKLAGTWRANAKNQLVFDVEKERGKKDSITFKAGWKVNDNHEIVYSYARTDLKTKRRITQELLFQGHWDLSEKNRLTYLLESGTDSSFRFRGTFQTKTILAKQGQIRYQVGTEISGRREIRAITLFGKFKTSRDLGLSFEMEYAGGRKRSIALGGEYALGDDAQIAVNLKTRAGQPLGVELIFTKDFFGKDGQAFVRLQKTVDESRIEAGARLRW